MIYLKNKTLTALFILFTSSSFAQSGIITGRVFNEKNNEAVPFANVVIQGTTQGVTTDIDGKYRIEKLSPALYNLEVTFIGFKKKTVAEIQVTNAKPAVRDIGLEEDVQNLTEVEVKASAFTKTEESPISVRTIGIAEIERNPGGNRDISKVIQNLPGVAGTPAFRNDIIIRGGSPNENRFYLDGVEVPNINHFATQGASGGPVGLLNINFIREVDYYSGAFPANRGNTLSSVFEFKQIDGRTDRIGARLTVGATDYGLTLEGPVSKKSNFIFSVRRSYLQGLFQLLKLPFLPTYNDYQLRYKIKFNDKNELTVLSLGAYDQFKINAGVNKGVTDSATLVNNAYILGNIPVNNQWNYTIGAVYKNYRDKGYTTVVLSRNMLSNIAYKHLNNDNNLAKTFDYNSTEAESKLRIENTTRLSGWKFNMGVNGEYARYTNRTFDQIATPLGPDTINFSSKLNFYKYGLFGQVSKGIFKQRLMLSLGVRFDGNTYSSAMARLWEQFSPRFSLSYSFNTNFSFNANVGRYYQLPAYTVLGYRNFITNELVNKANNVSYIRCDHAVAGFEYTNSKSLRITVEGFYKQYANYPFLLREQISLANLGGDFGVVGNAPVTSTSTGRSYGAEFLLQQKLIKGFYGIMAYTFVRSEFANAAGKFIPSSWDNRHIVNVTLGKKFKRNWQVGAKIRFSGGSPSSPYDTLTSSLKTNWDVQGFGFVDYSKLNTNRLPAFHGLDLRVDKQYFFKKWTLGLYFDIQNAYNFKAQLQPILDVERKADGTPTGAIVNPTAPLSEQRYKTRIVENLTGTVLPTLGVIIDL